MGEATSTSSTSSSSTTTPTSTVTTTSTTVPTTTTVPATTTTTLTPLPQLPSGLFCRDLFASGYSYEEAINYWILNGQPDRMDADGNGIPCETVYPKGDVVDYWGVEPPTTTSTTSETSPVFVPSDPSLIPGALPGSGGAAGSGCTPGTGTLPDGIWFGFPADRDSSRLGFDLACLTVDETVEGSGLRITNDSSQIRTVPVASNAVVYQITWAPFYTIISYADWTDTECAILDCPLWIYVNGGRITHVVEQFIA
jgi:hypothetical protein